MIHLWSKFELINTLGFVEFGESNISVRFECLIRVSLAASECGDRWFIRRSNNYECFDRKNYCNRTETVCGSREYEPAFFSLVTYPFLWSEKSTERRMFNTHKLCASEPIRHSRMLIRNGWLNERRDIADIPANSIDYANACYWFSWALSILLLVWCSEWNFFVRVIVCVESVLMAYPFRPDGDVGDRSMPLIFAYWQRGVERLLRLRTTDTCSLWCRRLTAVNLGQKRVNERRVDRSNCVAYGSGMIFMMWWCDGMRVVIPNKSIISMCI